MIRKAISQTLAKIAYALDVAADKIEGEEMPEMEVAITKRDINGKGIEGKVASKVSTVYVVAQRVGYCEWEPLHGEKKDTGERTSLPACFTLRHEATIALEEAR